MRLGMDHEFGLNEDKQVVMISLGSDFVAEHECGIAALCDTLGCSNSKLGVERQRITDTKHVRWVSLNGIQGFDTLNQFEFHKDRLPGDVNSNLKDLYTGWDDTSFGCYSNVSKTIEQLREVYDAIMRKDACLWLGSSGTKLVGLARPPLCIGIISRMPNEVFTRWAQRDQEELTLFDEVKKTKIVSKLAKANKGYYALKPTRQPDGSIKFWLNPYDQDKNRSMWCTLDDLNDWIKGKGRIIKTPEEQAKWKG